jgi:hypothetical protein
MRTKRPVYGFIYIWTNSLNGMKYLGKRWGNVNDTYKGSGKYFRRALAKYGEDKFTREIIEYTTTQEELRIREQYWLDFHDVANNKMFYNICPHAGGGHHGADYNGDKNPMWGKKHPNHVVRKGEESNWYGRHLPGALNPNAKKYLIVDNNGVEYKTSCLKEFVYTKFTVDPEKIYSSLKLQALRNTFKPARAGHCKGWRIRYDC